MSDSNGNSAVIVAILGLATTIAGGVFSQWDKIFASDTASEKAPEAMIASEPPAAGAPAASEPEPEQAPAAESESASEPGR